MQSFDLIIIGGAKLGLRCALIEENFLGGTCVNLGCVPKKIMWHASQKAHARIDSQSYGFTPVGNDFDFTSSVTKRQNYIQSVRKIYEEKLEKKGISLLKI